jgi:hypothetical protein
MKTYISANGLVGARRTDDVDILRTDLLAYLFLSSKEDYEEPSEGTYIWVGVESEAIYGALVLLVVPSKFMNIIYSTMNEA